MHNYKPYIAGRRLRLTTSGGRGIRQSLQELIERVGRKVGREIPEISQGVATTIQRINRSGSGITEQAAIVANALRRTGLHGNRIRSILEVPQGKTIEETIQQSFVRGTPIDEAIEKIVKESPITTEAFDELLERATREHVQERAVRSTVENATPQTVPILTGEAARIAERNSWRFIAGLLKIPVTRYAVGAGGLAVAALVASKLSEMSDEEIAEKAGMTCDESMRSADEDVQGFYSLLVALGKISVGDSPEECFQKVTKYLIDKRDGDTGWGLPSIGLPSLKEIPTVVVIGLAALLLYKLL